MSGIIKLLYFVDLCYNDLYASVAQLFRALPCQGRGRELESLRSHQSNLLQLELFCWLTLEPLVRESKVSSLAPLKFAPVGAFLLANSRTFGARVKSLFARTSQVPFTRSLFVNKKA